MFNKTYVNLGGGTKHVYSRVDVTEKRAPTDGSVKLLREMEAKALSAVLDGFLASSNGVEIVGLQTSPEGFGQPVWHYAFRLNGGLYEGRLDGPEHRELMMDRVQAFRAAIDRMSNVIAGQLFESAVATLDAWKR